MQRRVLWWLAAALIGGGCLWVWWRSVTDPAAPLWGGSRAATQPPGSIPTAVVAIRDINFSVIAAGEIGPLDAVSVRPEIGGTISRLPLDIGDRVKKGDVLFELDDKDLQTEKLTRQTEVAGATLAVETQHLELQKSQLSFDRVRGLFESQLAAKEDFDNARLDHELNKNRLDIARNRLETAKTALQQVDDKLVKTVIRAPFDCTILTRPVSVGQAVSGASGYNSGTEVFTIANLAEMVITAHLGQSDVSRLKVGQTVQVEVEAVADLRLVGHVDRLAPQATLKNGIKGFSTRILLKDAEDLVRPGMTANLSIPLITAGNVRAVPLAAVFNERGERFVYVQSSAGRFERRLVQLGLADYDHVEVLKGLQEGEVVALVRPPAETAEGANPNPSAGPK